jgi:predicted nucleic acid-binding protein
MAEAERGEVSLYMSPLVLVEVIWVLKSFYRYSMTAITHVVIALVSASGIEVDNRVLIIRAVELARDQNVDFADAYIALQAAERDEKACTLHAVDPCEGAERLHLEHLHLDAARHLLHHRHGPLGQAYRFSIIA